MVVLVPRQLGVLTNILPTIPLLPTPQQPQPTTSISSAALTTTQAITQSLSSSSTTPVLSTASITTSTTSSSAVATPSSETTSIIPSTTFVTPLTTPVAVQTITSNGDALTVTQFTTTSPSPTTSVQAESANGGSGNGFLQNKVLSGVVFGLVGLVVLVILVTLLTLAIRRSRKRRLVEEAISFDPAAPGGGQLDRDSLEKSRFSLISSDHSHGSGTVNGALGSYAPPSSVAAAYARPDPYRTPAPMHNDNPYAFSSSAQQPQYGNGSNIDSQPGTWLYPSKQLTKPPTPPNGIAFTQAARY